MIRSNIPVVRLGDVVDRVTKGTTPTTHGYQYTKDGVAFVRVENLRNGVIDSSSITTFISADADRFLKRSSLEKDDVLISIAGTIGRTAVVREQDLPANTNQAVAIIRGARKKFAPVFLRYALESPLLNRLLTGEARGGAMQNISLEDVENVEVPSPPLDDQRQIVAEIEKQFTRLEAGVAGLRRVQANLKRYRAAVLKAACEGKLVPTEAEVARQEGRSFETGEELLGRVLTERRQKWSGNARYKEPNIPDAMESPKLPEGWTWCLTDALFFFVTSGSRGWARYYSDDGSLFLRIGNLDHGSIRLELDDVQYVSPPNGAEGTRTRVLAGDFLISITADVGMIAIAPTGIGEAYINQHVALARPVNCFSPEYLAWYLAAEHCGQKEFLRLQRGATKAGLGLDDIRSVPVPLPPLTEQLRIVAEVERRLSVVEELEAVVNSNLQRATRLRQSILQRAFEGRLVQTKSDGDRIVQSEVTKNESA